MKKRVDLVSGNIIGTLITLSLPILGTSFIQMAYNLVDMIWIGKAGSAAVAAIGTAGFFSWFGNSLVLITKTGAEVGVSQSIGKNDECERNSYIYSSITLALIMAIVYTVILILFKKELIGFFNLGDVTPNACLQAIGMFIIVLNTDCEKYSKSVNNAFVFCSIGSYGVYLANVLFINIFDKILSFNVMGNAALTIVLECIAVFIICNIFIRLMSKVPVLEKFSGI